MPTSGPAPLLDPVASLEEGPAGVGVLLSAHRASVSVAVRGQRRRKPILRDVSASFAPGSFCALMGPSGAGKSTLLHALRTGRCSSGALRANGAPYTRLARRLIVSVPQDDILLPGLSPLEMLHYAAQLRLPASVGAEGRLARAREVLRQLHFSDADMLTRIGSVDERGLSGGQRKRVSIGLELLTNPPVLLVDEPTSGLDAKMAQDVVSILHALAREGRTVVATLHQPSARIFRCFDSLLLLASGRVAYAGPAAAACGYFEALGLPPPPRENPAEFFLRALQDDEEAKGVDLLEAWEARRAAEPEGREPYAFGWDEGGADAPAGEAAEGADGLRPLLLGGGGGAAPPAPALPLRALDGDSAYAVGALAQTSVLLRRRLYDAAKDRTKLCRSLLLKLTLGILVGVIWVGSGRDASFKAAFPTSGALFLVVNNSIMDVLFETVLQFPMQRALLQREYANGAYCLPSYYAALQLSNLLLSALSACLLAAPVYAFVGLSASWAQAGYFVLILALMSLIGSSLGVIVGATTSDIDSARSAIVPTLVPLLIFSGYLIPYSKIPPFFKWAYYASFFQCARAGPARPLAPPRPDG